MKEFSIGDRLVQAGVISEEQRDFALNEAHRIPAGRPFSIRQRYWRYFHLTGEPLPPDIRPLPNRLIPQLLDRITWILDNISQVRVMHPRQRDMHVIGVQAGIFDNVSDLDALVMQHRQIASHRPRAHTEPPANLRSRHSSYKQR